MFVVTADQIGSRDDIDRSAYVIAQLTAEFEGSLVLPIDQTSGDEIQAVTDSADAALGLVLSLSRAGRWSIGLGVGDVRTPLPDAARKATGTAFIAAREAVEAAKRSDARFALRGVMLTDSIAIGDVEPLIRLLLLTRGRRTDPGWEVVDLVRDGTSQKDAAALLDISGAAVSTRLKSAAWHVDREAQPAIVRLLTELDANASHAQARSQKSQSQSQSPSRSQSPSNGRITE